MHALIHYLISAGTGPDLATMALLISDLLALLSVPSVLLNRRGRPVAAMAWILALFVVPFLGTAAWWLSGRLVRHLLEQRRRRRHADYCGCRHRPGVRSAQVDTHTFSGLLPHPASDAPPPPSTSGNRIDLLVDGMQAFPAMERAIERAEHRIHALFYIWTPDETGIRLRDQLANCAREGLDVRVLIDGWGAPWWVRRFFAPLREAGGQVAVFLPPRPWHPRLLHFRNHRKLLVVDGHEAFTGGMNVGADYEHDRHDFALRVRGPAAIQLDDVFLDDWYFATGEEPPPARAADLPHDPTGADCAVIASGPHQHHNRTLDTLFQLLTSARERILLTTPYFIPAPPVVAALRGAALRGVDVRLLLPEHPDVWAVGLASASFFPELLEAGVRVFGYRDAVLHGKALVVDEDLAVVGSANADSRSFRLSFELSVLVRSRELAGALAAQFEHDQARSSELARRAVQERPRWRVALESLAHLSSPLL